MSYTKIEWTDKTWNPVTGCTPVSEGCANCYAARMAKRLRGRYGYPADDPFRVTLHHGKLNEPAGWRKPSMVFVCSMGDLFHEDVPDEFIAQVWGRMGAFNRHTFQVLTKRPQRMAKWLNDCGVSDENEDWIVHGPSDYSIALARDWPLPNVWLGTSVENEDALWRVGELIRTPAAKWFVNFEPLLGPVDPEQELGGADESRRYLNGWHGIDWIIAGGESGPGARPMHPDWARSLRDQCQAAGVSYFFKQWGEYGAGSVKVTTGEPVFRMFESKMKWIQKAQTWVNGGACIGRDGHLMKRGECFEEESRYPVAIMHRVGKKKAGRLLDGRTWDEFPRG